MRPKKSLWISIDLMCEESLMCIEKHTVLQENKIDKNKIVCATEKIPIKGIGHSYSHQVT